MLDNKYTSLYFTSLVDIINNTELTTRAKYRLLRNLLEKICKYVVKDEVISLSNLFSRLSFICNKYNASRVIHSFRMISNDLTKYDSAELDLYLETYWMDVNDFISYVFQVPVPDANRSYYPFPIQRLALKHNEFEQIIDKLRVNVLGIKDNLLLCDVENAEDGQPIRVQINEEGVNASFSSIEKIWKGATLHLINIGVDDHQIHHPKIFILEPDYLIDVSAIAECFQDYGTSSLSFIKSKFDEIPNNKYLLIGNFANAVMDELVGAEDAQTVDFNTVFVHHFENYPFEHTACPDILDIEQFKQYRYDCETHFNTIKRVYLEEFVHYGITNEGDINLEPSFLCNTYGVQGRLDLLHSIKKDNLKTTIVELKSGGTVYPDDGVGVKPNHTVQLYLYHLMLSVVYDIPYREIGNEKYLSGFIFYSKPRTNNLRKDQINLRRVQAIFELRNRIVLNEHILKSDDLEKVALLLHYVKGENIVRNPNLNTKFKDMLYKQIDMFTSVLEKCSALERTYFYSFVSFIAREQYISKLGASDYEGSHGLASLWIDSAEVKKDKYSILYDLEIIENKIFEEEKQIIFRRTLVDDFVNFRKGDVCVLYPRDHDTDTAVKHQIFKCTIQSITKETVTVVFRHKQRGINYFNQYRLWALERDSMDSSFTSMYKSLYAFMNAPKNKREVILNVLPPRQGINYGFYKPTLSVEQNRILNNALSAEDYFVLNGPPGTGKTSHIIKELIEELYTNTNQNILLLAYTNKAVDELCGAVTDALEHVSAIDKFVRIGSPLSSSQKYADHLVSTIIKRESEALEKSGRRFTRNVLSNIIRNNRVFLSTVATMSSKNDVFKLKKFDTVIIDEASQILEPQIIGLLPKCKRFIMIGDHKQLPAIVVQSDTLSKTNNPLLEQIGLADRRNSLFERLYNFCELNKLSYAHDTLTYQGRMHREIAAFPNIAFYEGKLKEAYTLENLTRVAKNSLERQVAPLNLKPVDDDLLSAILAQKRVLFVNVEEHHAGQQKKTSEKEADFVVQLLQKIEQLYQLNGRSADLTKRVGIIAPFKNQIALIKNKLEGSDILNAGDIVVDTVERFQGGQRDIIIYSFTINEVLQLDGVVSLNEDQSVDRKLNVALTRAKEQMIIIGNAEVLSHNSIYKEMVTHIKEQGGYFEYDSL
ncbi:AAA domain-containing protein [Myroides odoratimimus]|uniref:AAA domain-containing protein n=1 Tax=Myroides odoratimimus TaxID=76832 RepID=UPI002576B0A5|nr:AAA domain-containing protein [Myroides odoratimimus]MDM1534685.1 AAA family ATPase [Myroides odoratimimus]MDM1674557.1 AAA family ATPase [Myroides odoratimimus]